MPGFLGQGQSLTHHADLQACFSLPDGGVFVFEDNESRTIKGNRLNNMNYVGKH